MFRPGPNHTLSTLLPSQKFAAVVLDVFMDAAVEAQDAEDGQIEISESDFAKQLVGFFDDKDLPKLDYVVRKECDNPGAYGHDIMSAYLTLWFTEQLTTFDVALVAQVIANIPQRGVGDGQDTSNSIEWLPYLGYMAWDRAIKRTSDNGSFRDSYLVEIAQLGIARALAARPGG